MPRQPPAPRHSLGARQRAPRLRRPSPLHRPRSRGASRALSPARRLPRHAADGPAPLPQKQRTSSQARRPASPPGHSQPGRQMRGVVSRWQKSPQPTQGPPPASTQPARQRRRCASQIATLARIRRQQSPPRQPRATQPPAPETYPGELSRPAGKAVCWSKTDCGSNAHPLLHHAPNLSGCHGASQRLIWTDVCLRRRGQARAKGPHAMKGSHRPRCRAPLRQPGDPKRHSRSSARNRLAARGWSRGRPWPASDRVSGCGRRSGSAGGGQAR